SFNNSEKNTAIVGSAYINGVAVDEAAGKVTMMNSSVQEQKNGGTYTAQLFASANGMDVKDWMKHVDAGSASFMKEIGGVRVMTSNGVKFDSKNGFSGGSFKDSKQNTAIVGNVYISGVAVNERAGKVTMKKDSSVQEQKNGGMYTAQMLASANGKSVKDWMSYVDADSASFMKEVGGVRVMTSNGVNFSSSSGFSGGSFNNSEKNTAIVGSAYISGVAVDEAAGKVTMMNSSVQEQKNGGTYTAQIRAGANGMDVKYWMSYVDADSASFMKEIGGVRVMTSNGVSFNALSGFGGGNFSDSEQNTAIVGNTYISGVVVNERSGKVTMKDSSVQEQKNGGMYTAQMRANANGKNVKDWMKYVDADSASFMKEIGGIRVMTSNGVSFDSRNGFSGGSFSDATKNTAIVVNKDGITTYITGVDVYESSNLLYYIDGAQARQGNYSATLKGTGRVENWERGLQIEGGYVKNALAFGVNNDTGKEREFRTSVGITFENGKFGGADFSRAAINADPMSYAVKAENGAWVTGVRIRTIDAGRTTEIVTVEGSSFDATVDGVRYIGALKAGYSVDGWNGLYEEDGKIMNVVAYGKFGDVDIRTGVGITFNRTTKKFGGVKFDEKTINANSMNYEAQAKNGAWIAGIKIDNNTVKTVEGSTFTYVAGDGTTYSGALKGGFGINDWNNTLRYENGKLSNVFAYADIDGVRVMTGLGVTFNSSTQSFGGAKFDKDTINANSMQYSAIVNGTKITGIQIKNDGKIYNVAGALINDSGIKLSSVGLVTEWETTYFKDSIPGLVNSLKEYAGNNISVGRDGQSIVLNGKTYSIEDIKSGEFTKALQDFVRTQGEKAIGVPTGDAISQADRDFAAKVWKSGWKQYDGQEMTDVDIYYINQIKNIYLNELKKQGSSVSGNENWLPNTIADLCTTGFGSYGPAGVFATLDIDKLKDTSDKSYASYKAEYENANYYVDLYGVDNIIYMMNFYPGGSGDSQLNFMKYLQYRYGENVDGNVTAADLDQIIRGAYGSSDRGEYAGALRSYEAEQLKTFLETANSSYDYYNNAKGGQNTIGDFLDHSKLVDANDTVQKALENVNAITEKYNLNGDGPYINWTMNGAGTVNMYLPTIFTSPDEKLIASGIYNLGVKTDGTYTLIGLYDSQHPELYSPYGIVGNYLNGDGTTSNVAYEIPVLLANNTSGIAQINMGGTFNIFILNDKDSVNCLVPKTPPAGADHPAGDTSSASQTVVRYLGYDDFSNADNIILSAWGAGSRITVNNLFSSEQSTSLNLMGEGTKVTNGLRIDGADIAFDAGYLEYKNNAFTPSSNFEARFRTEKDVNNYVERYIARNYTNSENYSGLTYDGLIDKAGNIINASDLVGRTINVNPFDYLAVMDTIHDAKNEQVGFGLRFDAGPGAIIGDVSGVVGGIQLDKAVKLDLFAEKVGSQYIEDFRISSIADGTNGLNASLVNWDSNFTVVDGSLNDISNTTLNVGDRVSLGTILHKHNVQITTSKNINTFGPNGETISLAGAKFGGDEAGHFVLKNDVGFNGGSGIKYDNASDGSQWKIMDLCAGSIIQLGAPKDGSYNMNVLMGISHVIGMMEGGVLDKNDSADSDGSASFSVSLFEGMLTESKISDGKQTAFEGVIKNWSTATMSQDFSTTALTREGS
ncbi:MAG: hypothetical protein FWC88_03175, partial [Endomicrobia bacterium]|nr:hypothetical protein [Endomicrobiia bacterium]